jgi:hypothetical protein
MARFLHTRRPMQTRQIFICMLVATAFLFGARLLCQPPPPRKPPGPAQDPAALERRIAEIRNRLAASPVDTPTTRELKPVVALYLDKAEAALRHNDTFQAGRFTEAADACRRPLDHLAHLQDNSKPPPPKPPGNVDDLRKVYFRLQLGKFFLEQIPDPKPKQLLQLAETFYQAALQARSAGQGRAAGEYTRAADDLTHALENVAQAYAPSPTPAPPQPPAPPPPPR